ncbi:MAG: RidA family protein [Planctomycetes bacterium]|nr:RidA family protein [Planctomycetota bacterium]
MPEANDKRTRRKFLQDGGTAAAVIAAVTAPALLSAAEPETRRSTKNRKKIIGGSPSPAYSRAVRFGDMVFVAGCVGVDKNGKIQDDFETQAGQTLLNLKESIERSGSSIQNVLKCTCFLKDYANFATFNKVYLKFFPKDPPARSTVVVKDFVVVGAKLEVDCVCCIDS